MNIGFHLLLFVELECLSAFSYHPINIFIHLARQSEKDIDFN